MHNLEEIRKVAEDFHLSRWVPVAVRNHHRLVLLYLQHCEKAACKTQQVRFDAGKQEQVKVLP